MKLLEIIKQLSPLEILILLLDDKNCPDAQIELLTGVSRSTIHRTRVKYKKLSDGLKMPQKEYGNPDVNLIVDSFKAAFGTTKATQKDRYAANRLAKKYNAQQVSDSIVAFAAASGDKFAPSVNSVSDFEDKLPSIQKFMKNKSSERAIDL